VVSAPEPGAERRAAILDAATRIFLRYGFKKTSMDDLARAAGLSRQGLYLHFATKEALFKEAVSRLIAAMRASFRAALARDDLDIEERLLAAFESIHAHAIEKASAENMSELLDAATALVGDDIRDLDTGTIADAARALSRAGVAARWKSAGISANALAENLYSTSTGVKHRVGSPAEYKDAMRVAVRIVCRGD
jgi:AcrR family transcriptional regulator